MNIDEVTMVQCLVLVSALLLASVWASVDCQLGIIVHKCRQRRPVNVCATALGSVGKPIEFLTMARVTFILVVASLLCTRMVSRVPKDQAPDCHQEHHFAVAFKHNCNTILQQFSSQPLWQLYSCCVVCQSGPKP